MIRATFLFRATLSCACLVAIATFSNVAARAEKPINLDARFAQGVMKSGEKQKNYLRVALNGCERQPTERTPVNVAFVIDRSGSMAGARIAQAREAAAAAIRRLDKNDIASVVIFDDKIDVLVQAQPVEDHAAFIDRIRQVTARGSTAIHGGVIEGAAQVKHNLEARRLNRVVLLSDGQANVGPRQPEEFAKLGRELLQQGISVSTIGVGLQYNEDLMLQLARASDGNHTFVGESTDLIQVFNKEFDDVLASCAQTVSIDIELKPGVRVVRGLSRDAKIDGQTAHFQLNQIYAATEHYVLMEVEVDPSATDAAGSGDADLGRVRVTYTAPQDGSRQTIETPVRARFSQSTTEIAASRDNAVIESVVEQSVRARTAAAIALRDQGRHGEAQALFSQNVREIEAQAVHAPLSNRLQYLKQQYHGIAAQPAPSAAARGEQRKFLRQLDSNPAAPGARY
jgi:Ca-activated chloride channel family protein